MQGGFDLDGRMAAWHAKLMPLPAAVSQLPRRRPIGQLIKSLISSRTRDAVSQAAYNRLARRYRDPAGLAAAPPAAVARLIDSVTFPDVKAGWLAAMLPRIARERPDFDLGFLGALPLDRAVAWLMRFDGVGWKVAASTLNASTLARPIFIVDTHVLRVLRRLGFVARGADTRAVCEAVTGTMPQWSGDDFLTFHMGIKRLGQTVCHPAAPDCGLCPLADDCPAAARRSVGMDHRMV